MKDLIDKLEREELRDRIRLLEKLIDTILVFLVPVVVAIIAIMLKVY